ncbi:Uncharacterized conserved protein [Alloiococcus otitis]|uniref:Schlafen group 3-like DNA/RNA helicase domain-containing protein n=1 Tax=Alloiococcus otitis ATCC 51267 TaxID=883081 RepID=K9E8F7_9LACT|nr:DNA/RNA helicase domain-containing protein [Alloiococcus otitis]EKU93469.1 hypothetical protein HMPREF9698_01001 [Alloiococcus otitis ATCC 51267]SUU81470.1 Uncharacterized conserved protein [Alloiococcus otitis]
MDNLVYSLRSFQAENKADFRKKIKTLMTNKGYDNKESQIISWNDCFDFLKRHLPFSQLAPELSIIFEYMLPLEGGKRPDVILLSRNKVLILEFKRKNDVTPKDLEQAINYRKNIENYHYETADHQLIVHSYVVYTLDDVRPYKDRSIAILTAENFSREMTKELLGQSAYTDVEKWLGSKYQPLESLVKATKDLFDSGRLPQIKRIEESDISEALEAIRNIVNRGQGQKNLIFISGVPGSGKTLVGLKSVYDYLESSLNPIFLSGNGPLVDVLQKLLSTSGLNEGSSAIRKMHQFISEYYANNSGLEYTKQSDNQLIVFDEAQRAWDDKRNKEYGKSEPKVLLDIADRIFDQHQQVSLICLIGDGQAIYTGEEKGMALWHEVVKDRQDWNVFIPKSYESEFQRANYQINDDLFLDVSIRNDFINIVPWIDSILTADLEGAQKAFIEIFKAGFKARLIRNPQILPRIAQKTKDAFPNDHVGLYISSKVPKWNFKNIFPGQDVDQLYNKQSVNWYLKTAHKLKRAATEFQSQGLESEWPIVTFGGDYYLKNNQWVIADSVKNDKRNQQFEDFPTIVENIYRVLLSRSRKGIYIYIPEFDYLDELYDFFKQMGIQEIK